MDAPRRASGICPDAACWLKPGTDPAEVYPTLARKPDAAKAAAFDAEIAAGYRLLAVLREEVASLRAELKRRRALEAKYSPSQPRVPIGNPRGGQWTDRSGGGVGSGDGTRDGGGSNDSGGEGGGADASDVSFGTDSENFSDSIVKIVADDSDRRYSVNLGEEEARGHTLSDHAGKSDLELEAEFKRRGYDTPYVSFVPKRLGSFESVESANDLVNRTLERNKATVDMVQVANCRAPLLRRVSASSPGGKSFVPIQVRDIIIFETRMAWASTSGTTQVAAEVTASIQPIRETTSRPRGRHDGCPRRISPVGARLPPG
jgi:hypothetical protein